METVTTAILDKFPNLRQLKVWIVLFVAIFGYIGGLIFTTNVRFLSVNLGDYSTKNDFTLEWNVLASING